MQALDHVHEWMTRENGARGGNRLGEVVDLVLVEYGVNDAWTPADELTKMNLPHTWESCYTRLEAVAEYIFRYLLSLPRHPAVVWLEANPGNAQMNPSPAHLQAAERFGIPYARCRFNLAVVVAWLWWWCSFCKES